MNSMNPSRSGIGDPGTGATVVVGAISAILLVIIIVVLQAYYYHAENEERARKLVAVPPRELSALRAEQLEVLHSYRWIDEKQGVVGIPIERAMALLAAEQAQPTGEPPAGAAAERKVR